VGLGRHQDLSWTRRLAFLRPCPLVRERPQQPEGSSATCAPGVWARALPGPDPRRWWPITDRRLRELAHLFCDYPDVIFLRPWHSTTPLPWRGPSNSRSIQLHPCGGGTQPGEMKNTGPIALLDSRAAGGVDSRCPQRLPTRCFQCQEARPAIPVDRVAPPGPDTRAVRCLLPVPAVDELLSALLTVIPMQLLRLSHRRPIAV